MDTSKFGDLSSKLSKYVPEELNPRLCLFNLRMTIKMTKQYLEDNPELNERVTRLLKEGSS